MAKSDIHYRSWFVAVGSSLRSASELVEVDEESISRLVSQSVGADGILTGQFSVAVNGVVAQHGGNYRQSTKTTSPTSASTMSFSAVLWPNINVLNKEQGTRNEWPLNMMLADAESKWMGAKAQRGK